MPKRTTTDRRTDRAVPCQRGPRQTDRQGRAMPKRTTTDRQTDRAVPCQRGPRQTDRAVPCQRGPRQTDRQTGPCHAKEDHDRQTDTQGRAMPKRTTTDRQTGPCHAKEDHDRQTDRRTGPCHAKGGNHRPLTAEARVRSQANLCGIYGRQNSTVTGFSPTTCTSGGTRWRSWLGHCATSRKVAGSIPNSVIGIFH